MRLQSFGWGVGKNLFNRNSKKSLRRAKRRQRTNQPAASIQVCEPRLLLSAAPVDDHELEHDGHFDDSGNEYHVLSEPDLTLSPETTGDFDGTGTLEDLSQTFFLHSNPDATHTIYLDFDGHVTSGTSWNSSFNGGQDIVTSAFDFESGTGTFTNNELARIQYIWQRVAEDFLPFDVNVTTQDPGEAALSKSGSGDDAWGIRVVIGGNGSWFGSAGGVAYVGSFNWSSDTPVFVFSDNLADAEKYVAEASSHEAGHALGLSHDGASGTSYYAGHGSGETGWAPIMGNSYYKNLTQWSRGEYSGANNTQDDLAIITSQNGFGYRADDYGDSNGSAGSLFISGTSASNSGIIETRDDVDVFGFTTGAGTISFDITGVYRGGNLDLLAELYDANGNLVASANPDSQLGASFSVTVAAGTYYLHIDGVGKGDPLNGGYTDYGSLGGYLINGTIVETTQTEPSTYSIAGQNSDQLEGDSGSTAFTFVVSRSGDTSQAGSVDFNVQGSGTNAATADDFSGGFANGSVSFAAGESSKTITIDIAGDTDVETDEEFAVLLSNASNGGQIGTGQALGSIRNDDQSTPSPSTYSISSQSADKAEGDSGQTAYTFVVTRSGDTTQSGSVDFTVQGSGANAANADDFDGSSAAGTVSFAAGETSKTMTVYVSGDLVIEADEQFSVVLSNASNGGEIGTGQADGFIRNDDIAGVSVTPTSGLTVDESGGTASFDVVLTRPPTADVWITVTSTDTTEGTVNVSTLQFTASNWNTPQTVTITGVDDTVRDGNQNFTIQLGPVTSSDANYDGVNPEDVSVTNKDNDKGGPKRSGSGGDGSTDDGAGGGNNGNGKGGGPKKAPALVELTAESPSTEEASTESTEATTEDRVTAVVVAPGLAVRSSNAASELPTVQVPAQAVEAGVALEAVETIVTTDDDFTTDESPASGSDRDSIADDVFAGFEELASELLTV